MGAPTKCTPELTERYCQAIRRGAYQRTACEYAGITPRAVQYWAERAEAGEEPYASFVSQVKEAEAAAVLTRLARIEKAGMDGVWQADAWYLERRYPEEWGRRVQETKHSGDAEHPVIVIRRVSGGQDEQGDGTAGD